MAAGKALTPRQHEDNIDTLMRHTFSGSGANRVDRVVDAVLPITQSWHSLDPHLPLGPVGGGSEEDIMLTRQAAHAAKAILDWHRPKLPVRHQNWKRFAEESHSIMLMHR